MYHTPATAVTSRATSDAEYVTILGPMIKIPGRAELLFCAALCYAVPYCTVLHVVHWRRVGARDCWSGAFSVEVFTKLPEYMRLSFPGLAGVFLEWTSFEASIFLAVSVLHLPIVK